MKHAKARNVIEKAFGVLKMRWAILRDTTWFSFDVLTQIVNACCLLHNFIKREQGSGPFELAYMERENEHSTTPNTETIEDVISFVQPSTEWTLFWNHKAQEMWANRSRR
ncbi:hypothetical protein LINPERHAP1_LOCUS41524 [Linum perenne]